MTSTRRLPGPAKQRGIAAVLFAAGTLAIVAVAGLALDLGLAYLSQTRLQNALDAAALSGAKTLVLTGSSSAASTAALNTFNANNVNLYGAPAPTVQTSPTLTPFAAGGLNPKFLRISVPALPLPLFFAKVVMAGDSLNIGGAAVAGPEPNGEVCGAIPMALCGTAGDSDCGDSACYGISPTDPVTRELQLPVGNVNPSDPPLGPGNYGLVQLGCSGASCVRDNAAGGSDECFDADGGTVQTQTGNEIQPTAQGLNTRFGVYDGPVSPADYPPDVVVTNNTPYPVPTLTYTAYLALIAVGAPWDPADGIPQRRVAPILVVDCSVPIHGAATATVIGSACLFLTRQVDGTGPGAGIIYGQLVATCLAGGESSETPPVGFGPSHIVLYQNPG